MTDETILILRRLESIENELRAMRRDQHRALQVIRARNGELTKENKKLHKLLSDSL